jgi:hypothetical protein
VGFTLNDLVRYDLSLFAVIDYDIKIENITSFQSSFAVNTIPTATLSLARGRQIKGSAVELADEEWDNASTGRPIEVWAKYRDPEKPERFKHVLLFAGETAGHSITKSGQSVGYNMTIRHWLSWLNEGSVYSPNLAPGSADSATFPATSPELRITGVDGGANTAGSSLAPKIVKDGVGAAFIADVWGKLLRPFLTYIAKENPLHGSITGQARRNAVLVETQLQRRVLYALKAVWGADDAKPYSKIKNPAPTANGEPFPNAGLPFRTRNANGSKRIDEEFLTTALADALLQRDASQLSNNTSWAKLIGEYAPLLLAEIWPHVEFARFVPSVGSIRNLSNQYPADEQVVQLGARDIYQIDLIAEVARDIRSVLITRPEFSFANVPTAGAVTDTTAVNYASFVGQETGLVLVRQAPPWLIFAATHAGGAGQQADANGQTKPVPTTTAMDEIDGAAAANLKDVKVKAADDVSKLADLAESYAQQLYNNEVLRGRQIQLACPYLSHVCPGAPIRFEAAITSATPPENADEEAQKLSTNVFLGKIHQLTHVIDVAKKTVGTTLLVGHVRTSYEDTLPKFTTQIPPLYTHNMTMWPLSQHSNETTKSLPAGEDPPWFWESKKDERLFVTKKEQLAAAVATITADNATNEGATT